MSLESARAKLADPSLGALTPGEMKALLSASQDAAAPIKRHGPMVADLIEKVIAITAPADRVKARDEITKLFEDHNVTCAIVKVWSGEEAYRDIRFGG